MKSSKKLLFGMTILTILLLSSVGKVSGNFSVSATFNSAWYADLDADGNADDIGTNITLTLSNNKVSTYIDLYFNIVMPSGQEYWFLSQLKIQKYTYSATFSLLYHFYNTATECGWYTMNTVGFASNEQFSLMDSIVFDPPGKSGGSPIGSFIGYSIVG